jgi:hypothetical protein
MPQLIYKPLYNNSDLFNHSFINYLSNSIKYVISKEKLYLFEMEL